VMKSVTVTNQFSSGMSFHHSNGFNETIAENPNQAVTTSLISSVEASNESLSSHSTPLTTFSYVSEKETQTFNTVVEDTFQFVEYRTYVKSLFNNSNRNLLDASTGKRLANKNISPFQLQITYEERIQLLELMDAFDKLMKQHNVVYFIHSGTLLGSYRHHDLIPWDDDIDVYVAITAKSRMPEYVKPLNPKFQLFHAGGRDKFSIEGGKNVSGYSWTWPYIDISYYHLNETFLWDDASTYGFVFRCPIDVAFPLNHRPLYTLNIPTPRDSLAFLIWTFGYNNSCKMHGYSHMVEGEGPSGKRNCEELKDVFPFVEHLPLGEVEAYKDPDIGVREILRRGDVIYRELISPEPKYAVGKMFELSLKDEFTAPPGVMPPVHFKEHMQ
jgi:hypothetical protein